jgi:hypothetical protein
MLQATTVEANPLEEAPSLTAAYHHAEALYEYLPTNLPGSPTATYCLKPNPKRVLLLQNILEALLVALERANIVAASSEAGSAQNAPIIESIWLDYPKRIEDISVRIAREPEVLTCTIIVHKDDPLL